MRAPLHKNHELKLPSAKRPSWHTGSNALIEQYSTVRTVVAY